jgi:hypothetical protein
MRRTSRLVGGCYLTMVRPLLERHPEADARQMQRDFLRVWSAERGQMMRADHQARGLAITPANLIREMDLCAKYVWEIADEAVTPDGYQATIAWTPMDQAWEDYDLIDDARIFWEESFPALAASYDSDLSVSFPSLHWRGDSTTTIRVSRA